MSVSLLAALFLVVATAYASVGFGGGSSYNALLVLSGTDFHVIPAIALTCNILVVSGGVYHFQKAGHLEFRALMPFVILSVPMAWLGGRLDVSETVFIGILGLALLATSVQMAWSARGAPARHAKRNFNTWLIALPAGGFIGLVAGVAGIGGGIFLAPLLYLVGWAQPRKIAALASGFILVNSIAGLAGQLMKLSPLSPTGPWLAAWPLFLAVIAGGQIGSRLGARVLPEVWVHRLTALLIFYVSFRLLLRWVELS